MLSDETFAECFAWLEKSHGAVEPGMRQNWRADFREIDDAIFCAATDLAVIKQPPGRFPTIERFRRYIADAKENARVKAWEAVKAAEPKKPLSTPVQRNQKHAAEAFKAINDIMAGRSTVAEAFADMARRWPGRGWEFPDDPRRKPRQGGQPSQ